jgi:hypothetical protein
MFRRRSGAPLLRDLAFRDPGDASCAAGVCELCRWSMRAVPLEFNTLLAPQSSVVYRLMHQVPVIKRSRGIMIYM